MNLSFNKARILIVEDERIIARDIANTITRLGHEAVGMVSKGEDAINFVKDNVPDLVLMDITLSGKIDGIEAAKIINQKYNIPVIYLTAHQDDDTIEKSKLANPYGYLTKPLDDKEINSAINSGIYRFQVELKLQEVLQKYYRLTENAADMIFIQSAKDFSYEYVNMSAISITGYGPVDFYANQNLLKQIVRKDFRIMYDENIDKIIKGQGIADFEYMIVHKSGKEVWLNQRTVVLRDKIGNAYTLECIVTDVSKRREYEASLAESASKLRAFSNHLQKVREDERLRISREIHDQLGQDLTLLKLDISMLMKGLSKYEVPKGDFDFTGDVKNINSQIDGLINKVRTISAELRPEILDKIGLIDAIERQAKDFQKNSGIECKLDLCKEDILVPEDKAIPIFRMFQEALINVARHSGAGVACISLLANENSLELTVQDNGKGIKKEEIDRPTSLGLLGMKERVLMLGGTIHIRGIEGTGTKLSINIPLK